MKNLLTDRVKINLCQIKERTEQSIAILEQAFDLITYDKRLSVFNALMKEQKSKQMLKEKASIFSDCHFRCKKTKSTPTTLNRNRPPFWGGSPASYGKGNGGCAPQVFFVRTMPHTQNQHAKSNNNYQLSISTYLNIPQLLDIGSQN